MSPPRFFCSAIPMSILKHPLAILRHNPRTIVLDLQAHFVGRSNRGSDPHISQSLGDLGQSMGQLWVLEFESIDPVGDPFRDT